MDEARPRPRPIQASEQAPHTRAELVRYFAWGYLSRRELNDRLRPTATPEQPAHSAA